MGKLKWGIMGPGGIARTFARSLPDSETGELYAVGSRALERANAFADEFGAPVRYGSYEKLLADEQMDAVYIALPNHVHLEWAIKTAQAGKHVLCEKPLTINAAETQEMLDAVAKTDVLLMEAFMYRCHPQTFKLVELIRDGAIGEVRLIQAAFSYDLGTSDSAYANIRRRNDAAGGGIMDVGCYVMSVSRLIAGAALGLSAPAEPTCVQGVAHIGERGRVDEWASASVLFENDTVADLFCGTAIRVQSDVRVWGTQGSLVVPAPWKPVQGQIVLNRHGAETETIDVPAYADCYALEADVMAHSIGSQQAPYPCMTWQDSLGNMKALDQWRAAVGLVFDAEK
jgi:predicted dehydrogenase